MGSSQTETRGTGEGVAGRVGERVELGGLPFLEVFNDGAHHGEQGGSGCGKYREHQ